MAMLAMVAIGMWVCAILKFGKVAGVLASCTPRRSLQNSRVW